MSHEILEKIKQAIEGYKESPEWEEIGKVVEVGDGILKISGLSNAQSQEVLIVEAGKEKIRAVALNLEEDSVGALVLGDANSIKSGDTVKRTKQLLSIAVGEQLLGRVVDPLGNPIDGKGPIFSEKEKPQFNFLENDAPNVIGRESVNSPLHTGIKAIDSMIPIGRGQRELIIGDRQTGKTAVALDTIINQLQDANPSAGSGRVNTPVCIYVAIGQKESKVAKIVETLKNAGALDYSIVVSASASSPAAFWYLAPFAGCAIGEYFRDKGKDAVVIYDDLSKHAWAYRQISLLLRRPPGREAYPGDVFYLHSRLLERAAKLSKEKGGGSLTALPIIETQLGDVTAYIPTNVISITDGQIYLENDLFNSGIRPAINAGQSVSRVGGAAQTKAMKQVGAPLRLELAQFRSLAAFVQFGSDLDEETQKKIERGKRVTEIMKQPQFAPLDEISETISIYAATSGGLDDVEVEKILEFETKFIDYLKVKNKKTIEKLKKGDKIDENTQKELDDAIKSFKKTFK